MSHNERENQRLRELFCTLAAPFVRLGREDTLRSYATRKGGEKLEALVSHGELDKLFALRELVCDIPDGTPCLYGLCSWAQGSYAEACRKAFGAYGDGSGIIIALDGSWMAVCREDGEPRLYAPAR